MSPEDPGEPLDFTIRTPPPLAISPEDLDAFQRAQEQTAQRLDDLMDAAEEMIRGARPANHQATPAPSRGIRMHVFPHEAEAFHRLVTDLLEAVEDALQASGGASELSRYALALRIQHLRHAVRAAWTPALHDAYRAAGTAIETFIPLFSGDRGGQRFLHGTSAHHVWAEVSDNDEPWPSDDRAVPLSMIGASLLSEVQRPSGSTLDRRGPLELAHELEAEHARLMNELRSQVTADPTAFVREALESLPPWPRYPASIEDWTTEQVADRFPVHGIWDASWSRRELEATENTWFAYGDGTLCVQFPHSLNPLAMTVKGAKSDGQERRAAIDVVMRQPAATLPNPKLLEALCFGWRGRFNKGPGTGPELVVRNAWVERRRLVEQVLLTIEPHLNGVGRAVRRAGGDSTPIELLIEDALFHDDIVDNALHALSALGGGRGPVTINAGVAHGSGPVDDAASEVKPPSDSAAPERQSEAAPSDVALDAAADERLLDGWAEILPVLGYESLARADRERVKKLNKLFEGPICAKSATNRRVVANRGRLLAWWRTLDRRAAAHADAGADEDAATRARDAYLDNPGVRKELGFHARENPNKRRRPR